jgi:putative transcriptional regulator
MTWKGKTNTGMKMTFSYKKLHNLIRVRCLRKLDFMRITGIKRAAFDRIEQNRLVSLDELSKICVAFDCRIGDIVSIAPETPAPAEED